MFPLRDMIQQGMIKDNRKNPVKQAQELLNFFGVATIKASCKTWEHCQVKFRMSVAREINNSAVYAWLRQGEIEGKNIECLNYDRDKFLENLKYIRQLTTENPRVFSAKMQNLCAEAGVSLVFIPSLPKTGISGATRWLTKDKALIQLSLRYGTNDHFWFSFFHEAAHIYLHGRRNVYIETITNRDKASLSEPSNVEEREANEFASNILIQNDIYNNYFHADSHPALEEIISFAKMISIHPGIVVGRLQHDGIIEYSWHNSLKERLLIVKN